MRLVGDRFANHFALAHDQAPGLKLFRLGNMLDLRILRDLWTEDGARKVFAQLVTHCVRTQYQGALSIRPNPGDEGIDTLVGEFGAKVRVFQAKYFCDGLKDAQQKQIRDSWKTVVDSDYFSKLVLWTLCLPVDLTTDEVRWWQGWRKRQMTKFRKQMELWTTTDFEAFRAQETLRGVFELAMRKSDSQGVDDVLSHLQRVTQRPLVELPGAEHLRDALFVRKIEAAGVVQHRAARTAFYNFELLRQAVAAGGTAEEQRALEDLQSKIYDLWEDLFNQHTPDRLGRQLYNAVNAEIATQDEKRLRCEHLGAQVVHKKGGLHYWADNCHAGWTLGFESIGRQNGGPESA